MTVRLWAAGAFVAGSGSARCRVTSPLRLTMTDAGGERYRAIQHVAAVGEGSVLQATPEIFGT